MQVQVYSDIACPWCHLVTRRFHHAVAAADMQRSVALVHRPYQLIPDASTEPRPLTEVMAEMFEPEQANAMVTEMTRLGESEGVEYRFDRATAVNTFSAHRLLWLALHDHHAELQARLARELYTAYHRDGRNVADHTELAELAGRAGLDGDRVRGFLASDEGAAEVRQQVTAARDDGIDTTPTFVFGNGERLIGASETAALGEALHRAAK